METLHDYDYNLPVELIAAVPAARRSDSRLMVVDRQAQGSIAHRRFSDLVEFVRPGDLLVVNDTRVLRARLHGKRVPSGGTVEFLLIERAAPSPEGNDRWVALCRPARRLTPGEKVELRNGTVATIVEEGEGGERVVEFATPDVHATLESFGEVPLPPYIVQRRKVLREQGAEVQLDAPDDERYQTVYAQNPGSVAAPTAGLHFTEDLLAQLLNAGVGMARLTLHVGPGTFRPVENEDIGTHRMHVETGEIPDGTVAAIKATRQSGGRIIAVGTTTVRSLEGVAAQNDGQLKPGAFSTDAFIRPGHHFRYVDALITNFHLPRSTLLMLVSALAGNATIRAAYAEAVAMQYRFYSYGDAMLIL